MTMTGRMMNRKRFAGITAALLLVLILSLPAAALWESGASDGSGCLVRLHEVQPFGKGEGFSVKNYGSSVFDLKNMAVSDGEGTVAFTISIPLGAGAVLTVVKEKGVDWFSSREDAVAIGERGTVLSKSFALADAGDDLVLTRNGAAVDSVCYGTVKNTPEGWKGEPVKIKSGSYLLRISPIDTDSAADWTASKPGYMNLEFNPDSPFQCTVTPFTFPECDGIPIYDAIYGAKRTVDISVYQMTSANMVALLCELERRAVEVRVLLEGDVLGGDRSEEYSLMKSLTNAGGEVRLINDNLPGNYERYSYVHSKYAVIDGERTIVTSENWTGRNLGTGICNRGWGAVIDSGDFAEYMTKIFEHDYKTEFGDVKTLESTYPGLWPYPGNLTYSRPDSGYSVQPYAASLVPAVSPYTSLEAMKYLMDGAERRIFSQQMDLGSSFSNLAAESPLKWMASAADRGLDCRFILDATISKDNAEKAVNMINATTSVRAVTIKGGDGFNLTHNKGVIADGKVWVGSVNWTDNSFRNNREVAVILSSPEVTEFFLAAFMKDWKANSVPMEIEGSDIKSEISVFKGGNVVTLSVEGPYGRTYDWTVDGSKTITTQIPKLALENLSAGNHRVSVKLAGTDSSVSVSFDVDAESPRNSGNLTAYIAAAAAAVAGIAAALLRGRRYR